ncbi:MAG: hypothetical protein ACREMA_10355 [Longimicrobiales bacterium]
MTGRLPSELAEGSGIAPATQSADRAWAITDGGPPLLFAIDSTGSIVSRVAVRNADKYDWEALASARCAAGTCLYIGDVGDNQRDRSTVRVYRVSEPAANAGTTEAADRFDFRYPDGAHDAEAIFVLPGEQLYVVTKGRSEPISVYRYPGALTRDSVVTLDLVQTLTRSFVQLPDMVTGAGTTPDGQWIVLRTYGAVQLYRLHDGRLRQELPDPISLQALHEFQGEGADLRGDGEILLLSEKGLDEGNPPISRMKCTLPPDLR